MGPGRIRKIRFYVYPLHDAFHKWGFDGISQRCTSTIGEIYGKTQWCCPEWKQNSTKYYAMKSRNSFGYYLHHSKKRLIQKYIKNWYYPSSQWWGWLCKRMWKDYFLSICHFRVWYCCANIGLLVSHWSQIKLGIVLLPYQLAKQSSLLIDLLSGTNETVVSM